MKCGEGCKIYLNVLLREGVLVQFLNRFVILLRNRGLCSLLRILVDGRGSLLRYLKGLTF